MSDLVSVIVSVYQRADALEAVLRALAGQRDRSFEVIVADDGSGPGVAAVVAAWTPRLGVPLAHVWQPDRGFRAAEIRNRGILASRGGLCVFLDGDCLPRPDFVAAHRRLAAPGCFVAGNRVLLGRALTERILREGLAPEAWTWADWLHAGRPGEVNRLFPLPRLPLGPLRFLNARRWQGARSANLAVARTDLDAVDGFDAAFQGWGLEDTDLVVRLFRLGLRRKDGRFATTVLHLWHPERDRAGLSTNQARLDALLSGTRVRALQGLSALEPCGETGGRFPVSS